MVGLFVLSGLRNRAHHVLSHDSSDSQSRSESIGSSSYFSPIRRNVPLIASPLDPKTTEWLQGKREQNNLTLKRRPTVAQYEANKVSGGMFRKQAEASPLELFFDLFFVANLAVFTYNHECNSRDAIGNYIGFFSILWTFWFHSSIHDVRFYVDSQLNRLLKFSQFAVFTALTGLSPIYNVISAGGETKAFHGVAMVLMFSRLVFFIQYGVVLWYVKPFKKCVVPLVIMMFIYLASAMAFLGTYLDNVGDILEGAEAIHKTIAWYVIVGVEAILVIGVSSIWRVLSFRRTHLVERVGLLTLIIMGEGVIGVIKSVAYVLDGSLITVWESTGRVIVGVLMIYLMFTLYFTPISHDRFGTIRQQVWILLHYPLHVAILLTEEASSSLLLWSAVIDSRIYFLKESLPNIFDPSQGIATATDFINRVNKTMITVSDNYNYLKFTDIYNYKPDLDTLNNLTSEYDYASEEWNEHASEILSEMYNETTNFFFENFHVELPNYAKYYTETNEVLEAHLNSQTVIFTMFWIAAGCVLVFLGLMYWIGKNNKTWEEWVSISTRLTVGVGIPFISIVAYTQPIDTGFIYTQSGWIVGVANFCYFFIVFTDNVVAGIWDRHYRKLQREGRVSTMDLEDLQKHRQYNGAFGPHDPYSHSEGRSHSHVNVRDFHASKSASPKPHPLTHGISHTRTDSNAFESESLVSENGFTAVRTATQSSPENPYQSQQYQTQQLDPNQGIGRVDTAYRGGGGMEAERMVSDNDETNEHDRDGRVSPMLSRPQDGHHRPEADREH